MFQRPGMYRGVKFATQDHKNGVRDALSTLNNFLDVTEYIAGNNLTIADFSILPTVSTFDVRFQLNFKDNFL